MAKKRKSKISPVFLWAKRILFIGSVIFLLALGGSWLFMHDGVNKIGRWVDEKTLEITSDMGFVVDDVLVEGLQYTDPDILKAVINIREGDPLFSLNPREAKELVERISWVKSARVERRFPDTIYIRLQERTPIAFWQKDQKLRLIDEQGEIITSERLERFESLMIVVGDDAPDHAPQLVAVLRAHKDIFPRVKSATWVGKRRWDMTLKPDILVKLPSQNIGAALGELEKAQNKDKILDKVVKSVDLREEGRVIIRTKPGDVTEYKQGNKV